MRSWVRVFGFWLVLCGLWDGLAGRLPVAFADSHFSTRAQSLPGWLEERLGSNSKINPCGLYQLDLNKLGQSEIDGASQRDILIREAFNCFLYQIHLGQFVYDDSHPEFDSPEAKNFRSIENLLDDILIYGGRSELLHQLGGFKGYEIILDQKISKHPFALFADLSQLSQTRIVIGELMIRASQNPRVFALKERIDHRSIDKQYLKGFKNGDLAGFKFYKMAILDSILAKESTDRIKALISRLSYQYEMQFFSKSADILKNALTDQVFDYETILKVLKASQDAAIEAIEKGPCSVALSFKLGKPALE